MCIALIHRDIKTAFIYNQVITLLLPIVLYFFVVYIIRYIKVGKLYIKKYENVLLYVILIVLLLYGIVRNMNFYPFY